MVSKVEECIVFNRDCALGFPPTSTRAPFTRGFRYFRFFERKPLPCIKFEAHGHHVLKTIFMVHGSNTTVVEYENTGDTTYKLRLTPLFVHRDYHALMQKDERFDYWIKQENGFQTPLVVPNTAPPTPFYFLQR